MEYRVKRKMLNRKIGSYMLTIPPYFFERINAVDTKEVIMTIPDENHILIEVVREVEHA